jgi:hypothetical protein
MVTPPHLLDKIQNMDQIVSGGPATPAAKLDGNSGIPA